MTHHRSAENAERKLCQRQEDVPVFTLARFFLLRSLRLCGELSGVCHAS